MTSINEPSTTWKMYKSRRADSARHRRQLAATCRAVTTTMLEAAKTVIMLAALYAVACIAAAI